LQAQWVDAEKMGSVLAPMTTKLLAHLPRWK